MSESNQARVVVVGAVNVDLVVAAPRLPAPGETVVGPGVEYFGGGKGANAAVAASRVGAVVSLIAAVGADDMGRSALEELIADGVDVAGVAVLDRVATGVALIVFDDQGENQIAVGAGANSALTADHVRNHLDSLLPETGCVLVSTEIPDDAVVAAVTAAAEADVACVLNPAPVTAGVRQSLRARPILTPNEHEVVDLGGAPVLVGETGAAVIVTRGGDGVEVFGPDSAKGRSVPAVRTDVRDTTGAGDTFNGVLAARLAGGASLDESVTAAVTAAGLSVAFVGARSGMPTADALADALAL